MYIKYFKQECLSVPPILMPFMLYFYYILFIVFAEGLLNLINNALCEAWFYNKQTALKKVIYLKNKKC